MEAAGRDEARHLSAIFAALPDAVVVTGADGLIRECNPAAEQLFGWSRDELVGRPTTKLVPQRLHSRVAEVWEDARRGDARCVITEGVRRDGSVIAVELTLRSIGEMSGAAGVYREVRGRRPSEDDLARRATRLARLAQRARLPTVEASRQLSAGHAAERIESALALMREELGMEIAWLSELTPDEQRFYAVNGDYPELGVTVGGRVARQDTICHRVVGGEVPQLIPDVQREPAIALLPAVRSRLLASYVGVPVELPDGRRWGILCAASARTADELGERDLAFVRVLAGFLGEQLERERLQSAQSEMYSELTAVSALLAALAAHNPATIDRSQAVVDTAAAVAVQLGLDDRLLDAVQQVSLLHDLGKVAIPDDLLSRPGTLTPSEWSLVRQHPVIGARTLAAIPALSHLSEMVRAEHERVDGTGYPDGLSGGQIPIVARIVFACDAYHAMLTARPHRSALTEEAARRELSRGAGTQFDREVVRALLHVLDRERRD